MDKNEPKPDRSGDRQYGGPLGRKLDRERQAAALPKHPEDAALPGDEMTFEQQVYASVALSRKLRGEAALTKPAPPPMFKFSFPDGYTISLPFELNEQQGAALESIAEWLDNPNIPVYGLKGYAGTGKTTIMRVAVEYAVRHKHKAVTLAAPTHRAKMVLTKAAGKYVNREDCMTLHTLLRLKPTFDMDELDLKNLPFNQEGEDKIPEGGVVIVDECSMLNDGLCLVLVKLCQSKNCKLLFVGDPAQLKPVKQDTLSLAFNTKYNSELTQVMRQRDGNPISFMLEAIRNNQHVEGDSYDRFNRLSPKQQGIVFSNSLPDCKAWVSRHLLSEAAKDDRNYLRILCGTNKMVQLYNQSVRNVIYGVDSEEYQPGELLTGYSNYGQDQNYQPLITNSADYIIREVQPTNRELIAGLYVNGWWVTLIDADSDIPVDRRMGKSLFIVSRSEGQDTLMALGQHLRTLQREALTKAKLKQRGAWDEFHRFKESFCVASEYKHGEYTLLRKTIDYGYALTVHKSQGGTYAFVMVDESDIEGAFTEDHQLRHQLKYVAFSRASEQVLCYTKRLIERPSFGF